MSRYSDDLLIAFFKLTSRFDNPNLERAHKHLSGKFPDQMSGISVEELSEIHLIRANIGNDQEALEFIRNKKGRGKVSRSDAIAAKAQKEKSVRAKKQKQETAAKELDRQQWLMNPMMQIVDYHVVKDKSAAVVANEVNQFIKTGWRPWGGLCAAAFGISPVGGNQWAQAIVKFQKVGARFPSDAE